MNPAKVVEREVQAVGSPQVFPLFRERICQESEATYLHPMAMGMGNFFTDPEQHSWYPDKPLTETLRAEYAREGVAQVEAILKAMDLKAAIRAMDDLEKTAKEVEAKYGSVVDVR